MKHFFTCKSCGRRVTALLDSKIALPDFIEFIDKPLLSSGEYCIDLSGDFYISISDKCNLKYHEDPGRSVGCCGPSLNGLPNLVCLCRSEVGREVSDCADPHFIILNYSCVKLKVDHDRLLERVLHLAIPEDERLQLETLLQYDQVDHLRQKLSLHGK